MARTAPVPNIPAIPGMNPGIFVLGGGGDGGGSGAGGGSGKGGKQGAGGKGGGKDAQGGGKNAGSVPGCTKEGEPVDVATGAVLSERVDVELPGVFPFVWKCTYNSAASDRNDAAIGHGWRHSFAHRVELRRRDVRVIDDGGIVTVFDPPPSPGHTARQPLGRSLTAHHDGSYTLHTEEDGLFRDFTPSRGDPRTLLLTAVRDDRDNTLRLRYDDGDALLEIVDMVGRTVRLRYTGAGLIASVEVMRAPTQSAWVALVQYEYSAEGDQVRVLDALGHERAYRYADHLLTSWTNRVGFTVYYAYDGASHRARCVETWGELPGVDPAISPDVPRTVAALAGARPVRGVHHRLFVYDEDLTEAHDTRGGVRQYLHNALGKMDKIVGAGGGVVTQEFDAQGNRIRLVDAEEAAWTWEYDAEGRVVTEIDPLGRATRFTYGDHRLPASIEAPNGGVWRFDHDRWGRQVRARDPVGGVVDYAYDERGRLCETKRQGVTIARARRGDHGQIIALADIHGETLFSYDHWGRLLRVRTKEGHEQHYQYNDRHELVALRDVRGAVTRYEYDGEGNLVAVYAPDGTTRRARYGGNGWITEVTDARGLRQRLLYDFEGEIVAAVNERGEQYRFEYDLDGRVVAVHGIDGRTVRHRYDRAGRLIRTEDADGGVTQTTYDLVGNPLQIEDPDGNVDSYTYDDLDFVVEARNPSATVELTRDLAGHVLREALSVGKERFEVMSTYVPTGYRAERVVLGDRVAWERDPMGIVRARLFDGARRQELAHDVMGRVRAFSYQAGLTGEIGYDPTGKVQSMKLSRPRAARKVDEHLTEMATTEAVIQRSYEYTIQHELAAVHDAVKGQNTAYAYDAFGQLVERAAPHRTERFRYDETRNRAADLEQVARGPGDRVTAAGAIELVHDDAGRVVEKRAAGAPPGSAHRYEWTAPGFLRSVTTPDGVKATYAYDAFGRRVKKEVSTGEVVWFVWDGNTLAAEVRQAPDGSRVHRTYVFEELYPFLPVAQKDAGRWFDFVTTPSGTPTELIDDAGHVGWEATLSAFGLVESETRTATDTAIRFQGQYHDPESGLHYNRFRYYDPELGRYLTPDPVGVEGGLNEYAYARNPIGWVDPLGWANGAALEKNMVAAGQPACPTGFQTHHVIPEQLYNDPNYQPLLGTNPHDANNGIHLPSSQAAYDAHKATGNPPNPPGQTIHKGGHAGYTNHVKKELDRIKGLPPCQQKPALAKLQSDLKSNLQGGTHSHTNSAGNTVNGLNCHGNVTP